MIYHCNYCPSFKQRFVLTFWSLWFIWLCNEPFTSKANVLCRKVIQNYCKCLPLVLATYFSGTYFPHNSWKIHSTKKIQRPTTCLLLVWNHTIIWSSTQPICYGGLREEGNEQYAKLQEISKFWKIKVNIAFCSNQNTFLQKLVKSFGQCVDSCEKVEPHSIWEPLIYYHVQDCIGNFMLKLEKENEILLCHIQ